MLNIIYGGVFISVCIHVGISKSPWGIFFFSGNRF